MPDGARRRGTVLAARAPSAGAVRRRRPAADGRGGRGISHLATGALDDLGHQLAQVVVGLVDDELAVGAAAVLDEVLDRVELGRGAEVLRVVAQALDDPPREAARPDALRARKIDELPVDPVARREPLVLVEHLPRV